MISTNMCVMLAIRACCDAAADLLSWHEGYGVSVVVAGFWVSGALE
jgi:hypothetical protein